jgi:hypothetical protein
MQMAYEVPPLPYDYRALEPYIDGETMHLGMLALVGRRFPGSLRAFILTVAVADDLVAFVVIATAYTGTVKVVALLVGVGVLGLVAFARCRRVRNGILYAGLGITAWVALLKSGVDPVVVGVAMGLLSMAYPAARADLEHATDLFRLFREQPTSELAWSARESVRTALSPNDRLQQLYYPLSSYLIVPLFALANAGIAVNGHFLAQAYSSPITLGILVEYVLGKPTGIAGFTWLATRVSQGRVRPPVDPERDHMRGPVDAPVTLVDYGDFECPYCGHAEPVIRELLTDFGDLRYVWRHLPLNDVHPRAQLAAEAAEAAAAQGKFWELYELLFAHRSELKVRLGAAIVRVRMTDGPLAIKGTTRIAIRNARPDRVQPLSFGLGDVR